MKPPQSMILVN